MKKTTMSKRTHERLVQKLIKDINAHPHKSELVHLMTLQVLDSDHMLC